MMMSGHGAAAPAPTIPRWWRLTMTLTTAAAAVCCLVLVAAVLRWVDLLPGGLFGVFGLLGCGLVWLVLVIIGLAQFTGRRRGVLGWAAPAVLGVAVSLAMIDVGPKLQWAVSRDALARTAEQCPQNSSPSWSGAVRLANVQRIDGHCHLFQYAPFMTQTGWVRLPDGPPERPAKGMGYSPIEGDWYRVSWDPF